MFSYTRVEKKTKQNNKNGEYQKPNLTLDVMKISAVVIRGYRQKHVPPPKKMDVLRPVLSTMTIFLNLIRAYASKNSETFRL